MNAAVLDSSVVLKWFRRAGERHVEPARMIRATFESGTLSVLAPPLLRLELINVAGRRWAWGGAALVQLAHSLDRLGFEYREPELAGIAHWTGAGLTAYDAAYVALAEIEEVPLVTDDTVILAAAPSVATPLASWTVAR